MKKKTHDNNSERIFKMCCNSQPPINVRRFEEEEDTIQWETIPKGKKLQLLSIL